MRTSPLDADWVDATVAELPELVAAGDEAELAARVVELIGADGGRAPESRA